MKELAKSGYKSISLTNEEYDRFIEFRNHYRLTNDGVFLELLSAKEELQKFASKITKVPEKTWRYT